MSKIEALKIAISYLKTTGWDAVVEQLENILKEYESGVKND